MIVGLMFVSQVLTSNTTATAATSENTDIELEDKAIKQELEPIETEVEIVEEEDTMVKQEDEEEKEENNDDDTTGTGLEEEDIMIDDNYSYDDDIPLELPFYNPMPFP